MSYTKQTWAVGDTITAAKLNHIEDGVAEGWNGAFYVTFTYNNDNISCDKTGADIQNALATNKTVIGLHPDGYFMPLAHSFFNSNNSFEFTFINAYIYDDLLLWNIWYYTNQGISSQQYRFASSQQEPELL